jgi:hypothetical protein
MKSSFNKVKKIDWLYKKNSTPSDRQNMLVTYYKLCAKIFNTFLIGGSIEMYSYEN